MGAGTATAGAEVDAPANRLRIYWSAAVLHESSVGGPWCDAGMREAPELTAALVAVRSITAHFHTATDGQLLADTRAIEALGRVVDGLRLGAAAQVEARSGKRLGEESLAFRHGARDGVELVEDLTGVSYATARMRVGLGSALAPVVSITGELLPGRYPALSDAVAAGEVGIESARVIVNTVVSIRRRADPDLLSAMAEALADTARHTGVEVVRDVAEHWALALDPDGAEPKERFQRRKRALKIGRTLADGTTTVSLVVTPEHLALLKELLQSRRRSTLMLRTAPGGDDSDSTDPEWQEESGPDGGEPRPRTQQDYDTVFDAITLATSIEQASGAVTHETVVTITAAELEARGGQGWTAGVLAGIPVPVIERRACTGGVRLLVIGADGEALHLGRSRRLFSPQQKKALTVAAGWRCQYPGCTTPAPFLEAHHAKWFSRDAGPTDVGNGVMLCSFHHHLIHATTGRVEIRQHAGDLFFVPKSWRGEYREHQRRQRGPTTDPRLATLRRRHDPARNPFLG